MNIALIIAGGTGNRLGQDIPKQFIHVDNKPIVIHTIQAFQNHPDIDSIAIVCLEGWETVLQSYSNQFNLTKLKWIFPGGKCGQDSIRIGIEGLYNNGCKHQDIVLIHDAVRPLVSQEIISGNIATCKKYGSAITAIKCTEAIMESDNQLSSGITIPRDKLFRTQTPQTFPLGEINEAHREALSKGIFNSVSSCTMMAEIGKTVYLTPGSEKNLKITNLEDVDIFKALLYTIREDWLK